MSNKTDGSVIISVELQNDDFQKDIKKLKNETVNNLEGVSEAVEKVEDSIEELGSTSEDTEKKNKKLKEGLDDTSDSSQETAERIEKVKSASEKLGTVALKAFKYLATGVTTLSVATLKLGIDFESAFAGVEKTVNASDEELAQFRTDILQMSKEIPLAATEIAGIAEAAGQLGIQNANLMKFTQTMADLGVATNMTSDEAATNLARFANIAGMSQTDFDRLGSVIVDLGNNLATTESEIVDMSMRLAGAGTQIHLSEAQIMGMAGALSSVGIEAEAGGTAFSTLMTKMQLAVETGNDSLADFADVAGMSAQEFKEAFQKDAAGAIVSFIQGLGQANEQGESAIKVLDDMGITEIRMRDALLRASGASEVFTNSMDIATEAWEKNVALTEEANKRYDTTESKLTLLQNSLSNTAIAAYDKFREPFRTAIEGGIEAIDALQDSLENGRLGETVDDLAQSMSDLASKAIDFGTKAIPPVLDVFNFILKNGKPIAVLIGGIFTAGKVQQASTSWNSAIKVLDKMADSTKKNATNLSAYQIVVGLVTKKVEMATVKQKLWNTIMSPKGITLMITAVAALTVALGKYMEKQETHSKFVRESNEALSDQKKRINELTEAMEDQFESSLREIDNTEKYAKELSELVDTEGNVIGNKERVLELIQKMNDAFPDLMLSYDEETGKIVDQNGAVKDLSGSLSDLITLKKLSAWIDANQDLYTQALKDQNELIERNIELQKKVNKEALFHDEYERIIRDTSTDYDTKMEALSALAESCGMTRSELLDLATSIGWVKKALADNEEQLLQNKEVMDEIDDAYTALEEKNVSLANSILNGIGLETFDATKGIEQIDLMLGRLDTLKEKIEVLEELNEANPEIYGDELRKVKETYNAQLDELKLAHRELGIEGAERYGEGFIEGLEAYDLGVDEVVDSESVEESGYTDGTAYAEGFETGVEESTPEKDLEENVEDMKTQGEIDGTAYGESDKEARVEKATEAADESKKVATQKANETSEAIISIIQNMHLPDKFVNIYANYIGFDKISGMSGGGNDGISSQSDYSLENTPLVASVMSNIGGGLEATSFMSSSRATADTAKAMASSKGGQISAANEAIRIMVQSPRQNSDGRPIQQTINFNQPIERPSQVSRAIEKTAKDLNKKGRL